MNAKSKSILNKKAGLHRQVTNHSRKRRGGSISNNDLDDVFSLKDEEFANMGYVDSMKMQEMQRFNIKQNKDFQV